MSCKLSRKETICRTCQILFSKKNKKSISKCHKLNFLPSMQNVKIKLLKPFFLQTKIDTRANSVDQDEMGCNELSHLDLHCLPFCF